MTDKNSKILIVWTTVAKKTDGEKIAAELLEKKLAACVSISSPLQSHYPWQGKLCVEEEFLLIIKTSEEIYSQLEETLLKIHPYDCPEVIALPASRASEAYEKWVTENVVIPAP